MQFSEILGLVAATCTTVALIPQVRQVVKTKETKGLSLGMYSLYTFGTVLWLVYGITSKNLPVICSNSVGIVLAAIILAYVIRNAVKGK